MVDKSMLDAMTLLEQPQARRVFEYLLENQAASELRLSYVLKMGPDQLADLLKKLMETGLVRTVDVKSGFSQSYIPTEKGFRMQRYLSGPSTKQMKF